jgi:hypothetical protein
MSRPFPTLPTTRHFDDLAEVHKIGVHEGWWNQHFQAIMLSIDQYAEAAIKRGAESRDPENTHGLNSYTRGYPGATRR